MKKAHRAHEAIAMYKQLYKVEKVVKTLPMHERADYRKNHAIHILNQLEAWLLHQQSAVVYLLPSYSASEQPQIKPCIYAINRSQPPRVSKRCLLTDGQSLSKQRELLYIS